LSTIAQLASVSLCQRVVHIPIQARASSSESSRRTCHRWMSGLSNAACTTSASPARHGRNDS
jgi:hypothetical protein